MKTFALILSLYASDGHDETYVVDHSLTLEDCAASVIIADKADHLPAYAVLSCVAEWEA